MSKSEPKSKSTEESPSGAFLSANATLVAWLIFLGFGSAVLALYYSHIHYLPELKWEESFSYLAAVSVLGGGIVAVYGLLLYIPGWIWSEFLIFDSELQQGSLCYLGPDGKKREPCFWCIGKQLVLPFAVLMIAIHLAMFADSKPLLAVTTIVGLAGLVWYSRCEFLDTLTHRSLKTHATPHSLLMKYTVTAGVAALASIVSVFMLRRIIDPNGHSGQLLVICTVAVIVSNLLVAIQFRDKPTRAVLTGIIAAITLLICGEALPVDGQSQSEGILKSFGVGDETNKVKLYLTEEGKNYLKGTGVSVDEAQILRSRLGEEYLVERDNGQRVVLPKNMVRFWSISTDSPELDATTDAIADGMATATATVMSDAMATMTSDAMATMTSDAMATMTSDAMATMTSDTMATTTSDTTATSKLQNVAGFASGLLVVLLFFLHYLINSIHSRLQRRRAADFWAAFKARRTRVVVEKSEGRISLGDAVAFAEIQDFFARLRFPRPELVHTDRLTQEEDLNANLIVLGGPDANEVSKHLSACMGSTLRFGTSHGLGSTVLDLLEPTIFHPIWVDPERELFHDYVLIYRLRNPKNREAQVLLIAGSPCHGAWAGIRHLTSESFLASKAPEKQDSFELLLKSEVHFGVPQTQGTHMVLRPLRAW